MCDTSDQNNCVKCESHKAQCLNLEKDVFELTQKLNRLLAAEFYGKTDRSCQTQSVICDSVCTQTSHDNPVSNCDQICQADSPVLSDVTSLQSNLTVRSAELLSLSTLDASINSTQDNLLMDIYMSSVTKSKSTIPQNYAPPLIMLPFISIPNKPFSNFDLSTLDQDTNFNINLSNRSLCYYGSSSYSYNGATHQPQPIPPGNYINSILDQLKAVLPDIKYNSILLTKYKNGSEYIGFHADNEPEIVKNSDIVTISLGQSRVIKFKCPQALNTYPDHELMVNHGDVFIMSQKSQNFFHHSVLADESNDPRISITLRMLNNPVSRTITTDNSSETSASPSRPETAPCTGTSENYTLFIGDSMFRHLDHIKMSSSSQKAKVFAFPGATPGNIQSKLNSDPEFAKLEPSKVSKIFVFCGANSVDKVIHVPFSKNSEGVSEHNYHIHDQDLHKAKTELTCLIDFLHSWSTTSSINFVNILPRESLVRNNVINSLNHYVKTLVYHRPYLNMVSTELDRCLFSFKDGYRKANYFVNKGEDNVHLNGLGIVRLAKHLKFVAHH